MEMHVEEENEDCDDPLFEKEIDFSSVPQDDSLTDEKDPLAFETIFVNIKMETEELITKEEIDIVAEENRKCESNKISGTTRDPSEISAEVTDSWTCDEEEEEVKEEGNYKIVPQVIIEEDDRLEVKNWDCDRAGLDDLTQSETLNDKNKSVDLPYSDRNGRFQCNICCKYIKHRSTLNLHIRTHTGERFPCELCGKSYSRVRSLRNHLRWHGSDKCYICGCCNKSFALASDLRVHVRTHVRKRSSEKPHSCSICNKSFGQMSTLNRHLRLHTYGKLFSCEVCKRSFSELGNLKQHTRTHTNERPFVCKICNNTFKFSDNLKQHIQRHHKNSAL